MGEIADDLIDGSACEICGQYFLDPDDEDGETLYQHGYPVVCKECWSQLTPQEKKFHQKAKAETL